MATTPFDSLRVATEHLGEELYRIPSPTTFFYNYIDRGTFVKNSGVTHTTFKAARVEPTSTSDGWSAITLNGTAGVSPYDGSGSLLDGSSGMCDNTFSSVDVGFDELTFSPRKLKLQGPVICRESLTFTHNPMQFMKLYVNQLANYVKRKIDLELRDQVIKLGTKLSIRPGALGNLNTGSTLTQIQPTSVLTFGWLSDIAAYMIRDGAANADGEVIEMGPDGPVFPLVIGIESIAKLVQSATGQGTRTDFQYADMGKGAMAETLRAAGATRTIGNFRLVPEAFPPRYTWAGSAFTQVEAFAANTPTRGSGTAVTAAYKNAPYEAAIIPHKRQFKAALVEPDNAGLEFDPTSYTGEWKFVTGGREIAASADVGGSFDPLHDYARHYARFVYAPEPIFTNFGWAIFFLRNQYDNQNTVAPIYVG